MISNLLKVDWIDQILHPKVSDNRLHEKLQQARRRQWFQGSVEPDAQPGQHAKGDVVGSQALAIAGAAARDAC